MKTYKPRASQTIRATQFDNITLPEGVDWDMGGAFIKGSPRPIKYLMPGDWVVSDMEGKHYHIMSDSAFRATYELAE